MIEILNTIDSVVWGPAMIALLLGTHIFLTVRTGFIQRKLPQALRMSWGGGTSKGEGDISNFGALATALAATIGTGSIVGVATAILAGGPGAVFWMWITGVFGMATKYVEVYASVRYRVRDHAGNMLGGAMYVWERAFTRKDGTRPWWAKLGGIAFAAFAVVATIGTGSAVQATSMTGIITSSIPSIPDWAVGIAIVVLVGIVIFGGVQSISHVCEKLVPVMAVAYAGGCIVILLMNAPVLMALQFGCARGLFSNESGLGSAPIIAAAAKTKNPAEQALIAMTGTFWSTVVICALTGIVLVSTMIAHPEIQAEVLADPTFYTGAQLASTAFATIPYVGMPILVIGMVSFSYSTILGWSYYGNRCAAYLFGKRAILPYHIVYVLVAFLGAIGVGNVVWTISDIGNALMAIPNIIAILLLSGLICRETKHYVYEGNIEEEDTREIPMISSK